MTDLYPAVTFVADVDRDSMFDRMDGLVGWWVFVPLVMMIVMMLMMSRMFFSRRRGSGGPRHLGPRGMKRMCPFPFPLVPIAIFLVFLAVWAMGPMSSTRSDGAFPQVLSLTVVVVIIVVGLVVLAAVAMRRSRAQKQTIAQRIAATRTVIRRQLNAIANDILKLEDEVRAAGNDDALTHYRNATVAYAGALGQLETADTATGLAALARRLDTAIWQLDAAGAVLDRKPLPPEPQTSKSAPRSQPPYRHQQRSGRSSSIGVVDLIAATLETGPTSGGPSLALRRHRSPRTHCCLPTAQPHIPPDPEQ